MKIVDSFIFYNELDLLFYRLSILDEYVDYFILVESTHSFAGHPKELYYENHKDLFFQFQHKIIHIVVDNFPYKSPNINYVLNQQWENEYHQRNCIQYGLDKLINGVGLQDDDILLTSDVDEIPNPTVLMNLRTNRLSFDPNTLNRLALDMYYYNLNNRIGEGSNWHGIKLMTLHAYKTIRLSFQQMRTWEWTHPVPIIEKGGWHLSYFGNTDFIINKIKNFSHQEYNNDSYINESNLEEFMRTNTNFINKTNLVYIPIHENTNLPYKYDVYLRQFYSNT